MNKYIFPFNTCEKPNNNSFIKQPYSVILNLISCIIIIYFLTKTKRWYAQILLLVILLFELFHSLSHLIHIDGTIQIKITHILAYLVNIAYFFALYMHTKILPNLLFTIIIIMIIIFDIYAFNYLGFIYYLTTQFTLFIVLFLYYYKYLDESIKNKIPLIIFLTLIVFLLFVNEVFNCEKMLSIYPNIPFHTLIEAVGILFVYNISNIFSKL